MLCEYLRQRTNHERVLLMPGEGGDASDGDHEVKCEERKCSNCTFMDRASIGRRAGEAG
jgi:hypothetical protein